MPRFSPMFLSSLAPFISIFFIALVLDTARSKTVYSCPARMQQFTYPASRSVRRCQAR